MSIEPKTFRLVKKNPSSGEYHGKLFDYVKQCGQTLNKTGLLVPAMSIELPDYKYQFLPWPLQHEKADILELPGHQNFDKVIEKGVSVRYLLLTENNERGLPMAYAYLLVYQEGQAWVPILPVNLMDMAFLGLTTYLTYKGKRVDIKTMHSDIWCPMNLSVNNGLHGFAYQKYGDHMTYLSVMWHQKLKNEAVTGVALDEMQFPIAFHLQSAHTHHNVFFNSTENVVIEPFHQENPPNGQGGEGQNLSA